MNVFDALKIKYPYPEWVVLEQVKTSTGVKENYGGSRYIDFFIMNCYPSKEYQCLSIEAKQSIGDFRSDIKNPYKQLPARFYSDGFYYLLDEDVFNKNKEEIFSSLGINNDGLMVLGERGIKVIRRANMQQEKSPFSFGFVASLLRNNRS